MATDTCGRIMTSTYRATHSGKSLWEQSFYPSSASGASKYGHKERRYLQHGSYTAQAEVSAVPAVRPKLKR